MPVKLRDFIEDLINKTDNLDRYVWTYVCGSDEIDAPLITIDTKGDVIIS